MIFLYQSKFRKYFLDIWIYSNINKYFVILENEF